MFLDRLHTAQPNSACVMESFDVTALYTNVSNDSAMQAIFELLTQHEGEINIWSGKYYAQIRGLAMGQRLAPSLAIAFMSKVEAPVTDLGPLLYCRTSRSDQQQTRSVFSSAKAVERRKKKIRATVSPRPGGIWRRGTIIFEGAKLTSAATMATTTTMAVASVPASVAVLADKNIRRLRKRPATKDRQSQTRVKLAISPELSESTLSSRQLRVPLIKKDGIPKPVVIRQNPESYKGPTFNCRILNAYNDGVATEHHDPSCTMVFPGLSKDGSCRCYYKVSSRDEYGCAVGFLYACKPLWNRSVVV
ncbi:unnamed protein product [Angiostrongylus costaricensis]|uniref:Reverse transcriptase domain-containing protein n=1 Tax=Angiostrongylus costaricensis TaxID=334426 RepID=A0A158PLH9_ANGCS|nr:unnamed protein product [Angiostrongylus costaricensis]